MIPSCSEASKNPLWSHFSTEFSWQHNFSWGTAFSIVFSFCSYYQTIHSFWIKINYTLSKTTECLSMSLVSYTEETFLRLAVWKCFGLFPAYISTIQLKAVDWVQGFPSFDWSNLIFCQFTWPTWCNSIRKCTPLKAKTDHHNLRH